MPPGSTSLLFESGWNAFLFRRRRCREPHPPSIGRSPLASQVPYSTFPNPEEWSRYMTIPRPAGHGVRWHWSSGSPPGYSSFCSWRTRRKGWTGQHRIFAPRRESAGPRPVLTGRRSTRPQAAASLPTLHRRNLRRLRPERFRGSRDPDAGWVCVDCADGRAGPRVGIVSCRGGGAGLLVAPSVGGRAVGVCAIAITVGAMTLAA
jgi:hypothetical protein